MKRWRTKLLLLAGVAAVGAAIPAASQQAPESLLPPGFEDPATNPQQPLPEQPQQEPGEGEQPSTGARPTIETQTQITDATAEDLEELLANLPPPVEIPQSARRPVEVVGTLGPENWGLGADAWGNANGRFLSTLMRRLDAPLPSRWTSILLRRALLTRAPAPSYVHPVDWVAERAWLLLRMGEADAARMLVQAVDVDRFTPKMFSVAVQTGLATADPAALCPLVGPGRKTSDEAVWPLSEAICAGLEGEPSRASALIDQARRRGRGRGVDLLLAEKVIGAGTNSRRAVTIQWEEVDQLNAWRFGLAAATGMEIPERLMNGAGRHVLAWQARAPMIPIEQRVDAAQAAAVLGVFSNASLVEMHSLLADTADVTEINQSVGGRLRRAYAARDVDARINAIRDLWSEAENPHDRYARQILTAVAASRIPPSEDHVDHVPALLASMFSAGMDREAARWSDVVSGMNGSAGDQAWALLAVGAPRPMVDISAGRIDRLDGPKARMLFAALAGLGRIDEGSQTGLARRLEVPIGRENSWTRMLDAAAQRRQPGTVALLSAVAMQTPDWRGVPPDHLYRIVRALRQVGLEYEARMIAVEALSRL